MMSLWLTLAISTMVAIVATLYQLPRNQIPSHLLNHPVIERRGFLTPKTTAALRELSRQLGSIPSVAREYDSYRAISDNIGEAVPYDKERGCPPDKFLIPNGDMTLCVLPGRIDVGKHFISTGGVDAVQGMYNTMVSRAMAFQRLIFNYSQYPVAKDLLESEEFQQLATAVCPPHKPILDPFQLNMVVQVPGQTVATHIDAPYFYRASRFIMPQWLLAVMVFSGLFQDDFVHQVQVVGYYHAWENERGSHFVVWDGSGAPKEFLPISGSANSMDGSKMVHATALYYPERLPPPIAQGSVTTLEFRNETQKWEVVSNGNVVGSYDEDDINFIVVYRARCFADLEDKKRFDDGQRNPWTVEDVLAVLRKDLIARGVISENDNRDPYDMAQLLLTTYVAYPLSPTALVPFNFCALGRLWPSLNVFLIYFCP